MQPSGRRRAARRRLCLPGGPPSPPLHCAGRDGGALSSQNVPRRPGGCSLGSRDRERRCGGWASCGPGDGGRRPAQMVATQVDRDGRGERSVPNAFALAVTLFPGMLCLEPLSRAPQVCLKPPCLKPLSPLSQAPLSQASTRQLVCTVTCSATEQLSGILVAHEERKRAARQRTGWPKQHRATKLPCLLTPHTLTPHTPLSTRCRYTLVTPVVFLHCTRYVLVYWYTYVVLL